MYDASKEIFHASSLDSTAIKKKKHVTNRVPRHEISPLSYTIIEHTFDAITVVTRLRVTI